MYFLYPVTSSLDAWVKLKQTSLFPHVGINWIASYHYCSGNHQESLKHYSPSCATDPPLYSIPAQNALSAVCDV